ncbi:Signal transduction histidine kinase [Collimonas arenae]|uniref:Virulence sensor protein BvgS n=1 Tax=Collimonas arenae TaxID=279058 RepID=A0A0A1FFM9_9BURK|nr:ATP-binding protein [Collimonas arenae]AIY41652.1 Signal transduction histidine kinase [Collimonas arenae]
MPFSVNNKDLLQSAGRVAASVKKSSVLWLLNRYQRGLLRGGAIALTIAILAANAFVIWSYVKDYVADAHYVYLTYKNALLIDIETKNAAIRRGAIYSEMLWSDSPQQNAQVMRDFSEHGGRVVLQASDKVTPQLALAQISDARPTASFAKYLSFAEELGYPSTVSARQRKIPLNAYYYNPDHTFLSILPAPAGDPLKMTGARNVTELIDRIAPDIGDPRSSPVVRGFREPHRIIWLPVSRDPFTGEYVFRVVQPMFDDNGHLFMTFVSALPAKFLTDKFHQEPYDGNFMILDESGKTIVNAWHDSVVEPGLSQRIIDSKSWQKTLNTPDYFYHDGDFTISESLSDTGWVLVYASSWRTLLVALLPKLLPSLLGTLGLITLLWIFVLLFDRKILMPLFQRSQRVFESENLNRTIIDAVPVGLSLLSIRSGETLLQNETMQSYDNPKHPLHRQFLSLYWDMQKSSDGTSLKQAKDHTLAVTLADGTTSHLLANLVKTKYQGAEVLLCSFSDVTTRKRLEEKLDEARAADEAANQAKAAFLATMSHEIRTPLNAILGNLELLERSPLSNMQADRLRTITSSSMSLLDIINDILDFSKVESGQMTLENIRFDAIDTVEQAATIFAPLADAKGLNLFYTVAPDMPRFYLGDATRLGQVLLNLLGNAIKFTESGKVTIDLQHHAEADGMPSMLVISISDTGIGISEAQQRELFQAFAQADKSITRRFGGSGLGLALCKRLVELMGGTITVNSRLGVGSTFSIHLPLLADTEDLPSNTVFPVTPTLFMLCSAPEWRTAISAHLAYWGTHVQLLEHPQEMPAAALPLLIFGDSRPWSVADEDRARERASRVIDATEDGPRVAVTNGKHSVVSCYCLQGLHEAITGAITPSTSAGSIAESNAKNNPAVDGIQAVQRVRVLVLEDNKVNLALIRDQLNALNYQADLTNNGSTALDLFEKNQYDIVLTDLSMPGMNGFVFTSFLRRRGAQLPVIAITAHATAEEHNHCKKVGITDVLLKPMSLDEIDGMVRRYVMRSTEMASPSLPKTGKPQLDAEWLQLLRSSTEESLSEIDHALSARNVQAVLEQLHSIKGAFSMVHEQTAVTASAQLEQLGRIPDLAALSDALPAYKALLNDVLKKLGG